MAPAGPLTPSLFRHRSCPAQAPAPATVFLARHYVLSRSRSDRNALELCTAIFLFFFFFFFFQGGGLAQKRRRGDRDGGARARSFDPATTFILPVFIIFTPLPQKGQKGQWSGLQQPTDRTPLDPAVPVAVPEIYDFSFKCFVRYCADLIA